MMNYFDKNKILSAAVILLLVINLGILVLLWIDRSYKTPSLEKIPQGERISQPERMSHEGGPKDFLIRELKLNDKQKQDYLKLVEEHQSEMRILKEKIRRGKDELWNSISKTGSDTVSTEAIASEIGNYQKQIELVTFRHFQKVKELCDNEQKKKFDEVIKEALKMMGPNNAPPVSR